MLQPFAQSLPETRIWDFFLPDTPCIGDCTNFEPHQHWAKTKCSYDFASDVTKDANGNTIEKDVDGTVTSFEYDDQNRMTTATTPDHVIHYEYDADGIRTEKTVDTETTVYLVDHQTAYWKRYRKTATFLSSRNRGILIIISVIYIFH